MSMIVRSSFKLLIFFSFSLVFSPFALASEKQGRYLGAQTSEIPGWFKESFLEFEEDVREAASQGKRVMLYFHQEGCPYCARLVEENFTQPEIVEYVKNKFDGIAINMWGDREVISVGGKSFTEKTFSEALKVQYTPTILFLNEQGKVILRLNGYYSPEKFKQALHFAGDKMEKKMAYSEFMLVQKSDKSGRLIDEDFFVRSNDLSSLIGPGKPMLAVYFESPSCEDCETLHQKVLTDPATRELVKKMNNVQLNVYSDEPIVGVDGKPVSAAALARQLDIGYTPSVVFYDSQGREVHRVEGFLKTFHFQSAFAYVLEKAYLTQPSFQRYLSSRGEQLREQGYDTDIWGYESAYPAR